MVELLGQSDKFNIKYIFPARFTMFTRKIDLEDNRLELETIF